MILLAVLPPVPFRTSIVIPTLNEEKYLPRALGSLQEQNVVQAYPDRFEFLVVDSGSEDSTREIAGMMGADVLKTGPGKLSARDVAFRKASGDVVFSADADCYYEPHHLDRIIRHFERDKEVAGVYGPYQHDNPFLWLYSLTKLFQPERFMGMNNACLKTAYLKAPFDLSIDQQDREAMIMEEEKNFLHRLESLGKVVYERGAVAHMSDRRFTGQDESFVQQVLEGKRFESWKDYW